MEEMNHGAGAFLGVAPDHMPALAAALLSPLVIRGILGCVRAADRRGFPPAARFLRGYRAAPLGTRLAAALMFVTAAVHLTVAFAHPAGSPVTALLLLNGVAFAALSGIVFLVRWWRPVAAVLLVATIGTYVIVTSSGREVPDQLGLATKLVELTALGLVLAPHRSAGSEGARRRGWTGAALAVLSVGVVSGGIVWGASLNPQPTGGDTTHDHEPGTVAHSHPPGRAHGHGHPPPTVDQRLAAARLAAETRIGIARYQDQALALADGYRPVALGREPVVHWENRRAARDGRTLDPALPEQLVYADTADGPLLLGAVFVMPRPDTAGPTVGGPLTRWHTHALCIAPLPPWFAGLVSPFGACPVLSAGIVTAEMMHVWTVENPDGPFAEQLNEEYLTTLRRR